MMAAAIEPAPEIVGVVQFGGRLDVVRCSSFRGEIKAVSPVENAASARDVLVAISKRSSSALP